MDDAERSRYLEGLADQWAGERDAEERRRSLNSHLHYLTDGWLSPEQRARRDALLAAKARKEEEALRTSAQQEANRRIWERVVVFFGVVVGIPLAIGMCYAVVQFVKWAWSH
jgi:hypothetical protein